MPSFEQLSSCPQLKRPLENDSSALYLYDNNALSSTTVSLSVNPLGQLRVVVTLVNLTGSESVKKTGSTGTRQKEGTYIRIDLLILAFYKYTIFQSSCSHSTVP